MTDPTEKTLVEEMMADQPDLSEEDSQQVIETSHSEEIPAPPDPPSEEPPAPPVSEGEPDASDVEPPGAEVEEPRQPQPPSESTPGDVFGIADQLGFGDELRRKYQDNPEQALYGLANAFKKVGEYDADAEYGRQVREYEPQFREFLQSQYAPQDAPEEKEGPPTYDKRILAYLESTPEGLLYAKPDAPPGLVTSEKIAEVQRYVDYQEQRKREFEGFDPERVRREAVEEANRLVEQKLAEQQQNQVAAKIIQERVAEPWFFLRDSNNEVVRDPQTGHEIMSKYGHRYREYMNYAYHVQGIQDPVDVDRFARNAVMAELYEEQRQAPPKPGVPQSQQPPQPPPPPPGGVHRRSVPEGSPPPAIDNEPTGSLHEQLMASNRAAAARGERVYEDFK